MRKMMISVIALLAAIVMAFLSTQAADSIATAEMFRLGTVVTTAAFLILVNKGSDEVYRPK
jgi:hypothetical protein